MLNRVSGKLRQILTSSTIFHTTTCVYIVVTLSYKVVFKLLLVFIKEDPPELQLRYKDVESKC